MRWSRIAGFLILAVGLAGARGFAQAKTASHQVSFSVVGMTSLSLNDSSPIALNLYVPTDGGFPQGETDTSKGLKYTVLNPPGSNSRIQVSMIGTMPKGTALRVEAIGGRPELGAAVPGGVAISNREQDLITDIPSCYTGRFAPDGVALRYSFVAVEPSEIEVGAGTEVTIRYTISDG